MWVRGLCIFRWRLMTSTWFLQYRPRQEFSYHRIPTNWIRIGEVRMAGWCRDRLAVQEFGRCSLTVNQPITVSKRNCDGKCHMACRDRCLTHSENAGIHAPLL